MYINNKFETISTIKIPKEYDSIYRFSDDLAKVELYGKEYENNRYGFIDKTGKEVIPIGKLDDYRSVGCFYDGLAVCELIGPDISRYVYIDKTGNQAIDEMYEEAGVFSNGKAKVKHKRFGTFCIDKNGNPAPCNKD